MLFFCRNERGTSAIEFAILSPVYLLLLMGMIAYGIYLGASHSVQQISAEAARVAIAALDATERNQIASSFIQQNAGGYPFVDPSKLVVTTQHPDANRFVVAIRYDARNLPIWGLFDGLPLPATTIERQATIRVGGL